MVVNHTRRQALGCLAVAMLLALPATVVLWVGLGGFGGYVGVLLSNRALHPLLPFGMAVAIVLPPTTAVTLVLSLSARELRETIVIAGVVAWISLVVFPLALFLSLLIVTGSIRVSMPS